MRISAILSHLLVLGAFAVASAQSIPDPSTLPVPPSVALTHPPSSSDAKITFAIDAIPPTAKYVIYAQATLDGVTLDRARATEAGAELSQTIDQLDGLAHEKGANLVVLFSNEHGVDLPIRQVDTPLRLRAVNPVLTAVLFQAGAAPANQAWRSVRFTTHPAEAKGAQIGYRIEMMRDTAGVTKAYWTYGNISRFVADAVAQHFDTVALENSADKDVEDVWLPGSDEPLKISVKKPVLVVTIYRSHEPVHAPESTASRSTSATQQSGPPSSGAAHP